MGMRKLLLIATIFFSLYSSGQTPMFKLIAKKASSCSYLLDQYSGAAAAYSLRLLDCDYAGALIRVRRSSDNTEQDFYPIGSGDVNLDTAALKTFVGTGGSDDGFVVTWYDQSGNVNNSTQSTTTAQARVMDNGVVQRLNDKPSLYFDGDDQYNMGLYPASRVDMYIPQSTSDNLYIHLGGITYPFSFVIQEGSSSTVLYSQIGTPVLYANNTAFSGTTRDDVYNFLNGSKIVTMEQLDVSNATYWSTGVVFSGYSWTFSGYVPEIISWTSDQSANRSGIVSNINSYYSIY